MNSNLLFIKLWAKNLISLKAISAILSAFGSLWLFLEISSFFLGNSPITDKLKEFWFIFLIAGSIIAINMCKPKQSYGCKLNNRDIHIELVIGDLFTYDGALIIGSNTTFDTKISRTLISEKSIQGQFTRKYYGEETQLDTELTVGLQNITSEMLPGERIGKSNTYPIGTVVRLNPKDRTAYIIAIAHINEHGVASGTFEELKQALAKLWIFISQRGLKETIVMPIIGSGFTRLSQSREEIVREIIKSFVAACSESTFCDRLTIVITQEDIEKNKINMNELENYITHICKYTTFASNSIQTGIPV